MKRRTILVIFYLFIASVVAAQQLYVDSLKQEAFSSKNDTTRLLILEKISNIYSEINPDSAAHYASETQLAAQKLNLKLEEVVALGEVGYALLNLSNYPR